MTNTYQDNASHEDKLLEELRCLRCVMERILRELNEGLFVDYQMEKFGKDRVHNPVVVPFTPDLPGTQSAPGYQIQTPISPCASCTILSEFMRQHPGGYVGDTPCDMCPNNPRKATCAGRG